MFFFFYLTAYLCIKITIVLLNTFKSVKQKKNKNILPRIERILMSFCLTLLYAQ